MSRHEKSSWFNLAVVGVTLVTFLALLPLLGFPRALGAFCLLGCLGLVGIGRFAGKLRVVSDERDRQIQSDAGMIAYSVFWLAFVGGSMGLWFVYRHQGSIPTNILPLFPVVAGWC